MNEYNLFSINPETMRMINKYYDIPSPRFKIRVKPNEQMAKAKGLIQYSFGEDKLLYAKDEREAIKRAKKRGWDINLLKKVEEFE